MVLTVDQSYFVQPLFIHLVPTLLHLLTNMKYYTFIKWGLGKKFYFNDETT